MKALEGVTEEMTYNLNLDSFIFTFHSLFS